MKKGPALLSRLSRRLLLTLFFACIGTCGFIFWAVDASQPDYSPEELAQLALANTAQASLTYTSDTHLTLPDRTLEYGTINGIQDAQGNQYLTGNVLGDSIAIYYFGQDRYVRDPFTGLWRKAPPRDGDLPDAPDISPLSNFDVCRIGSCELVETTGRFYHKTYHIIGDITPDNQWIADQFQHITYSLWIQGKEPFVQRAVITAETTFEDVTGVLQISMELQPGEEQLLRRPLPE